jgi:hypothetical protein
MGPSRSKAAAAGLLAGGALLGLLLTGSGPTFAAPATEQTQTVSLTPLRVGTASQSRCGPAAASGGGCVSFDGRDVRSLSDLWVVGYENNRDLGAKHVLQTVAVFGLTPLRGLPAGTTVSKAVLSYSEASTVRRSPSGDSEYGILPTCNTGLGIPADGWDGSFDRVVPTRPAAVGGVQGATTGGSGAWDVTPQLQQWLAGTGDERAFVLRGDDESLDVRDQSMCLSYVFDLGLAVELTSQR